MFDRSVRRVRVILKVDQCLAKREVEKAFKKLEAGTAFAVAGFLE